MQIIPNNSSPADADWTVLDQRAKGGPPKSMSSSQI